MCNPIEGILENVFAWHIDIKYVNKNTLAGFLFFIYQLYLQKGNIYFKYVCRIFGFSCIKYICRIFFSWTYVHRQRRASFCVHICVNVCIYVHALVYIFSMRTCVRIDSCMCVCMCVCVCVGVSTWTFPPLRTSAYGVATVSRIDKITSLFCRISSVW